MNPFVILADGEAQTGTLSTLVSSFTDAVGTQFAAAAPGVIGAAAGVAVVLWGVPKLIGFFKRSAK